MSIVKDPRAAGAGQAFMTNGWSGASPQTCRVVLSTCSKTSLRYMRVAPPGAQKTASSGGIAVEKELSARGGRVPVGFGRFALPGVLDGGFSLVDGREIRRTDDA
ncbi:hypothetical protein L6V77_35625, partial [Myxococcota bacterium]|nr:hypothetical protein [Myxococcota bacterium]